MKIVQVTRILEDEMETKFKEDHNNANSFSLGNVGELLLMKDHENVEVFAMGEWVHAKIVNKG